MIPAVRCLAAVVALAVPGACGGTDSPAREQYLEDANAICAEVHAGLRGISERFSGDTPLDQIVAFLGDVYVPRLRDEIGELRDLGYPEGDRDELESIFDGYESVLDEIEAEPDRYAASGDDPFAAIDPRLDGYGLEECGSGRG